MSRIIRASRTLLIEGMAPEVLRCEVEVTTYPLHMAVQLLPEVTLRSVEFADGCSAYRPSDYARLVAGRYGDPARERHLDWLDVQQACRESVAQGEHLFDSPVAEFMDQQRRAA